MKRHVARVKQLIEQGDQSLAQGDFAAAEETYRRALAADPHSVEAFYSIGCVYSHLQDFQSSAEWAKKALSIDPQHAGSHALIGNALFGQERYEEAIAELRAAYSESKDLPILAQIGLCFEKLGKLSEAEETLRSVLEYDTAYTSRGAQIGLFQYSVFFSDVHHALARVLQRQGHREEAWLHYHLAKRHDPQIELDPMFREIISEADLEDHPYFDRRSEPKPYEDAELGEKLAYLIKLTDYDALVEEVAAYRLNQVLPEISALIAEFQKQGQFFISARLRLVGDIADGTDAHANFCGLATTEWQQAFELAEALHSGEGTKYEVEQLARRIIITTEHLLPLYRLAERFVILEPETGIALAQIIAASTSESKDAGTRAEALRLVGKAHFRTRDFSRAEEILTRSAEDFDNAREAETSFDQTHALQTLQLLGRTQTVRGRSNEALLTAERALRLAESLGTSEDVIIARCDRARSLAEIGRHRECFDEALLAAALAQQHGIREELREHLIIILLRTAAALGIPAPSEAINGLSPLDAPESVRGLYLKAEEAAEAGRLSEAIELLEKARVLALDSRRYPLLIGVLHQLGVVLHKSGRSKDAVDILEEALLRAQSMPTETDLWVILWELAQIAHEQGDQSAAIGWLESALEEARREADEDRVAQTHEALAMLLIGTNPQRAIEHMSARMDHGGHLTEDMPELVRQAAYKLKAGQYKEARRDYESLLAIGETIPANERATALVNLAACLYATSEPTAAIERWEEAREAFCTLNDPSHAIEDGQRAVVARKQLGLDTADPIRKLVEIWAAIKNPGLRCSSGIKVAECAVENDQLPLAERIATECLAIASSKEWHDQAAELDGRMTLGKICRLTGRYADAFSHYESSLQLAQELRDEPKEGTIHGWMAIACRYLGQFDASVEHYTQAIRIAEHYGDTFAAAWHQFNFASVLFDLGRREEAVSNYFHTLAEVDHAGNKAMAQRVLVAIATNVPYNELPDSVATRVTGLEFEGLDSPDSVVRSYALTTRAWRMAGWGEIQKARDLLGEVIHLHESIGDRYNQAASTLNRARLLHDYSPEAAAADAIAAKELAASIGHDQLGVECDEFLLHAALKAEDAGAIEDSLHNLLPAWLSLRRSLRNDADRIHLANEVVQEAERCVGFFLRHGNVGRAFDLQEYCWAQALSDLLASSTPRVDEEVKPQQPTLTETPHQVVDLPKARELLASLRREAVVITLGFVGDELVAMSLRRGQPEPTVHPTGVTREDITKLLGVFRHEMHTLQGKGAVTWPAAAACILRPVDSAIQQDDLVVLVTEEELQPIPLHAVKLDDGRLLIERAAVIHTPSLTVLAQLLGRKAEGSDRRRNFLSIGVAFPEEALAIQRRFAGQAFTGNNISKAILRKTLPGTSVVHLSCHGHFDPELYLESGLCLKNTTTPLREDILSIRDLKLWHLDNDLITLSACESGLGEIAVSEFLGLTRSLLAAGADSVIATLWRVNAKATLAFMLSFYEKLGDQRRDDDQADIAEILRQTQLETLRNRAPLRDWAGFKLIGCPTLR